MQFYVRFQSNGSEWGVQVKTGGNWEESNYFYQMFRGRGTSETAQNYSGQSRIFFGASSGIRIASGIVEFGNVEATDCFKIFRLSISASADLNGLSSNSYVDTIMGGHDSSTAVTGVRLAGSALASGSYVLEGLAV